jgi:hypothetical protein
MCNGIAINVMYTKAAQPEQVQGLTLSKQYNDVVLDWKIVVNATEYLVFKSQANSEFIIIGKISNNQFVDSDSAHQNGSKYMVRAVNQDEQGPDSEIVFNRFLDENSGLKTAFLQRIISNLSIVLLAAIATLFILIFIKMLKNAKTIKRRR